MPISPSAIYPADSTTDLWATGTAVDYTDLMARGEWAPVVGPKGVYWLDDRYSFWTSQGRCWRPTCASAVSPAAGPT